MQCGLIPALVLLVIAGQEKPAQKPPEPSLPPYVENDQRQFSFYPGGKLDLVASVPGNIKVIGWGRSSVMVKVERIVYHLEPEPARLLLSQYPLQVRWTPTTATIRTNGPPKAAAIMEVNLTIYVPKDKTDIKARILQGDLALGALNGWVEADLGEGSVEAVSLSGYFSAVTKRGDINVDMAGTHWVGQEFAAVTQKGTVALILPLEYSAALLLETRDGDMKIDYPEQKVEGESVPFKVLTKNKAHSLTASIGEGGPPVKLLTMSGDVKLTAK